MPINLTNHRLSVSLDDKITSNDKKIKTLNTQIKAVNNSLGDISKELRLEKFKIAYLTQLRENLDTVKNKNPAKQTVYLHSSRGKGDHFSHHKGLAVRLHLGDKGYAQAVDNLKDSGITLNSGAGKKIAVADMRHHIDLALKIHTKEIASLEIKKAESTKEEQALNEQKKALGALSEELQEQRNRPEDLKRGVLKLWGSNCGAAYINGLCRAKVSTLRPEAASKKPGLAEVTCFYQNSDNNSHINSFSQKAIKQVEKVLELNDEILLQVMDTALTEPSGTKAYFRGASLPDNEIQKYQDAYNSALPIESSFFMAVTPEKKDARPFAEGKYSSHKDRPVMFTVIGNPFTADSAYEQESLFKPGSQFKVISIDTRSPTASIVLSEADRRSTRAILV